MDSSDRLTYNHACATFLYKLILMIASMTISLLNGESQDKEVEMNLVTP